MACANKNLAIWVWSSGKYNKTIKTRLLIVPRVVLKLKYCKQIYTNIWSKTVPIWWKICVQIFRSTPLPSVFAWLFHIQNWLMKHMFTSLIAGQPRHRATVLFSKHNFTPNKFICTSVFTFKRGRIFFSTPLPCLFIHRQIVQIKNCFYWVR